MTYNEVLLKLAESEIYSACRPHMYGVIRFELGRGLIYRDFAKYQIHDPEDWVNEEDTNATDWIISAKVDELEEENLTEWTNEEKLERKIKLMSALLDEFKFFTLDFIKKGKDKTFFDHFELIKTTLAQFSEYDLTPHNKEDSK